jgi:hypothetical protein
MQKLLVLLAIVLFAGFTIAQHTDVVNQTGNNNYSDVDQGFMSSPGPGLPGNEAFVDQIGNKNFSDVDQYNGGFAGDQHWAKAYQGGNENTAYVFQERAAGDAFVNQLGNKNWADIFQTGNFGTVTAYVPYDAFAQSVGNRNQIFIDIWGSNATAFAQQQGNDNYITQVLGSAYGEKVQNSDFEAVQLGNRNFASQWMDGEGFAGSITALNNFGKIFQDGNDNTAYQNMLEGTFPAAANNNADAYQLGNTNWSEQWQTGAGNTSTHNQIGNSNVSHTNQN